MELQIVACWIMVGMFLFGYLIWSIISIIDMVKSSFRICDYETYAQIWVIASIMLFLIVTGACVGTLLAHYSY